MAVASLKGTRTRYINIIKKDLENAQKFVKEDIEGIDEYALKDLLKVVKLCDKRLTEFSEKLQNVSDSLTIKLEADSKETEVDTIVEEDCKLCSDVSNSQFGLSEIRSDIDLKLQLIEEKPKSEITQMFEIQTEMQKQIKDLLTVQQESFKHEKDKMDARKKEQKESLIKLPKLELKHYDGDRLNWLEFWDCFVTTIHENKKLSNVEKFNYLLSVLSGEAKSVIAGLSLSNDNYLIAVQLLKERFGELQNVIDSHYSQLINLKPATTKTESLRELYDLFEKNIRSLETLKQDVNQAVFISMLTSKLPKPVLTQLEIQKGAKNKWSVVKLRELLHDYICAKERADQQTTAEEKPSASQGHFSNSSSTYKKGQGNVRYHHETKPPRMSAEALFTGQREASGGYQPRKSYKNLCRYCEGKHWSDECRRFRTVEERKEKIKGSCFRCLRTGHRASECKLDKTCVHCKKTNHHHRSLCPSQFPRESREIAHAAEEIQRGVKFENSLVSTNEMVLMQTVNTRVKSPDSDITETTRILLDSGSQRTYITEHMAKKLNLKYGEVHEIKLVTFGEDKAKTIKTPTTCVDLRLNDGTFMTITANVVPKIAGEIIRRPVNVTRQESWKHLFSSFDLADNLPTESEKTTIELLIGNDYYLDVVLPQKVEVQPGLYLLGSRFGWILSGRTSDISDGHEQNMLILTYGHDIPKETSLFTDVDKSVPLVPDMKDFWNLENIGINDKVDDKEDEEAQTKFDKTVTYENNRYFVSWPWKNQDDELPVNYELAYGRLRSILNKLKNNNELLTQYDSIIQEQHSRGMIERVAPDPTAEKLHYIPHHAVYTPTKPTTKLRLVFDASAKTKVSNNSLNDCLYRGPVMLQDLSGLLLRFRLNKIALTADIEKAFLQVGLLPTDRDVTRFLWVKDTKQPPVKDNLQEYRFLRIPFGVVSSPFLLAATIQHHVCKYMGQTTEKLKSDLYVDNLITGVNSVVEALDTYHESKKILQDASMNLREWLSNSPKFMEQIPLSDHAENPNMKVLGLQWNSINDEISLQNNMKNKEKGETKREILGQIASVFDPLGLLNPVVLNGKLFLQQLWNKGLDWDEKLEGEQIDQWQEIEQDLRQLHTIKLPRYVGLEDASYRLVCFCDASKDAYAVAVYLCQNKNNLCKSDLVYAKSRVAPKKELSIPRLELLAVLIGTRCVKYVKEQLDIPVEDIHVLTDSQCVLQWLNTNKQLTTFVHNRVKEIKQHKDITFSHVRSKDNAADIASRGTNVSALRNLDVWWHGPDWLSKQPEEWLISSEPRTPNSTDGDVEIKEPKELSNAEFVKDGECELLTVNEVIEPPCSIEIKRFSSAIKLFRVTALVIRFIRKLKTKLTHQIASEHKQISSTDLHQAENLWVAYVQKKHYQDLIKDINGKRTNNLKKQLGLYIDNDGLLRCQGRIDNADLCEAAKHPLLLPKNDPLTTLLVERSHKQLLHAGVAQTLCQIRQKYWIPHGRSTVKSVLKNCRICRKHEGGPFTMPDMPQLPKQRVTKSTPFSNTGLDYLGPLYVKHSTGTKKVWVCLFTCLVTRAIHLELIQDMSAEQFLLGLRRFIARRGTPTNILSDNASQFKLSSDTLSQIWGEVIDSDEVTSYVANSGIKWKFIVERAPWMGGAYERLVGLVKRNLRKSVGKTCLTNEQMLTYINEVEAVVNSRPLVYIGEDINSSITLTPAHFLTLNPKTGTPENEISEDQDYDPYDSSAKSLLIIWKKGQKLLNKFWKLWTEDYLLSLRERYKNKLKSPRVVSNYIPNVGDIVLIHDDLPRGTWKMGKICELNTSYDGQIRAAKVLTANGRIIGRPLNLLYPVECPDTKLSGYKQIDNKEINQPDERSDERSGERSGDGGAERRSDEPSGDRSNDGVSGQSDDEPSSIDNGVAAVGRRPQRASALESRKKLKQLILSDSV